MGKAANYVLFIHPVLQISDPKATDPIRSIWVRSSSGELLRRKLRRGLLVIVMWSRWLLLLLLWRWNLVLWLRWSHPLLLLVLLLRSHWRWNHRIPHRLHCNWKKILKNQRFIKRRLCKKERCRRTDP